MADFSILKQQIAAALPENTEGEITATIMVAQFWAAIDAINTAKADQGDLDDLALEVAGKADIFGTSVPLALEDNELTLKYDDYQFDLGGDDMTLTLRLSYGFETGSDGVRVYAGRGLAFGDEGVLEASLGDGLAFDASGAIVPDFTFVQATISDLDTIRSGAAAGATAVQPADVSDCVRSASVSTIVSLSQAEYDALADKDANTFYVIV